MGIICAAWHGGARGPLRSLMQAAWRNRCAVQLNACSFRAWFQRGSPSTQGRDVTRARASSRDWSIIAAASSVSAAVRSLSADAPAKFPCRWNRFR